VSGTIGRGEILRFTTVNAARLRRAIRSHAGRPRLEPSRVRIGARAAALTRCLVAPGQLGSEPSCLRTATFNERRLAWGRESRRPRSLPL
jgi:hypothetical protein